MKPDTAFRFVNVRPVQKSPMPRDRFVLFGPGERTGFQSAIAALPGPDSQVQAATAAEAYLASTVHQESGAYSEELHSRLMQLVAAAARGRNAETARDQLARVLDQPIGDWLARPEMRTLRENLWDAALAHALSPATLPEQREVTEANLRAFYALEYVADMPDEARPLAREDVATLRIVHSRELVPARAGRVADTARDGRVAAWRDRIENTLRQVAVLLLAARELRAGGAALRSERLGTLSIEMEAEPRQVKPFLHERVSEPSSVAEIYPANDTETGSTTVVIPPAAPWFFDGNAETLLSESTRELLQTREDRLRELPSDAIARILEEEAAALATAEIRAVDRRDWGRLAGEEGLARLVEIAAVPFSPRVPPPADQIDSTPQERGIRVLGMGDLLALKQKLLRYAPGEVAHIENVLQSESKSRTHSRLREVEETIVTETEEVEESEKDLQSTERFELHREAQRSFESSRSFEAGVSVTASYGPVSITAHSDLALNSSVSESSKSVSTYAREVTERAVSKLMRRAREERTRRTLERFEEKNSHGFDNSGGAGNVTGVYRWVDKYYRARVVNYGRRLMLEFVVPEPAAFYLAVTSNRKIEGVTLPKPRAPQIAGRPLSPKDLAPWNFSTFIAEYGVQDAVPYPEASITVGAAVKAATTKDNENAPLAEASSALICPEGYEVYDVSGYAYTVGRRGYLSRVLIGGSTLEAPYAAGLEKVIPISIGGFAMSVVANVVVRCSPRREAVEAWQLKTFTAIMTAYERALGAYNEQVSAARIQQGVAIEGRNPELNRKIEREELRKAAIRMLTDDFASIVVAGATYKDFDFHAMSDSGDFGYPEFSPGRALLEGRVIQFFEQAFEWNNMVYRFYPYFWGRKSNWDDRFPLADTDPLFADFLRAGAARLVVPVHPAYPETVLHFMRTGEIWNGGQPPLIDDPLYVSIIDELRSDAQVNDDGDNLDACSVDSTLPCYVDEWDIKLPTTLVYLQQDATLPVFSSAGDNLTPIAAMLDEKARESGRNLDWRFSVVDLLKLLGRESSFSSRRELALKHGCTTQTSAAMNTCLWEKIVSALTENEGSLPDDF